MSRRRKPHAPVSHERWLVSYADFVTLLFAFFVVLYSTSRGDNKKVVQMSAAIHGAFQELGAFPPGGPASIRHVVGSPADAVEPSKPPEQPAVPPASNNNEAGAGSEGADVDQLKRDLEEALGDQIKRHEIEMHVTPEGLVVSLHEVGFFDSGASELLQDGQAPLGRIAHILSAKGFQVRVEGHTDNVPIHTAHFKSNWELSTARATEVVALLVERYGFDPMQVSAAGYSQYRPIASNETEEARKINRRVDLVVVSRAGPANKDLSGQAALQAQRGN
jgi:chemotaxis protein MotB